MTEEVRVTTVVDGGNSQKTLADLRAETKGYKDELVNLEQGTKEYETVLTQLGQTQNQINSINQDLQATTASLNGAFVNLAQVGTTVTAGFTAIKGAQALLGTESELLSQTFVQLQAGMALVNSLSKLNASNIKKTTVAFKALNTTLLANPIIAIGAAVVLLVGYFTDWREELSFVTDALDELWEGIKSLIPGLEDTGNLLDTVINAISGVATALIRLSTGPLKTVIKLLKGDFKGAWEEAKGAVNVFANFEDGYTKSAEKNAQKRTEAAAEEERKRRADLAATTKKLIEENEAKYGSDYKYTKEGKALYDKYYEDLTASYKEDSEEFRKANNQKLAYDREFTTKAKAVADERIKALQDEQAEIDKRNQAIVQGYRDISDESRLQADALAEDKNRLDQLIKSREEDLKLLRTATKGSEEEATIRERILKQDEVIFKLERNIANLRKTPWIDLPGAESALNNATNIINGIVETLDVNNLTDVGLNLNDIIAKAVDNFDVQRAAVNLNNAIDEVWDAREDLIDVGKWNEDLGIWEMLEGANEADFERLVAAEANAIALLTIYTNTYNETVKYYSDLEEASKAANEAIDKELNLTESEKAIKELDAAAGNLNSKLITLTEDGATRFIEINDTSIFSLGRAKDAWAMLTLQQTEKNLADEAARESIRQNIEALEAENVYLEAQLQEEIRRTKEEKLSKDELAKSLQKIKDLKQEIAKNDQAIGKANKKLTEDDEDRRVDWEKATVSALNAVQTAFGEHTVAGKAAAVAGATIDTYKAATGAYASLSSVPFVGPALGAAAAAAAIAAGVANVKAILSTKVPGANDTTGGDTPGVEIPSFPEVESPIVETHNNLDDFEYEQLNQRNNTVLVREDYEQVDRRVQIAESKASY